MSKEMTKAEIIKDKLSEMDIYHREEIQHTKDLCDILERIRRTNVKQANLADEIIGIVKELEAKDKP